MIDGCCSDPGDCMCEGQMTVDEVLEDIAREQAAKTVFDAEGNEGTIDEVMS